MTMLPLKLDFAIRQVGAHYLRRQRLRGWLAFGTAFLALLLGLGAAVALLADTPVPLAAPFGLFAVLLGTAGYRWLYRPLRRGMDRRQIALFLDAHHPELEDLVLSSVVFSESEGTDASAWMVAQVLQRARELGTQIGPPALANVSSLGWMRRLAATVWLAGVFVLVAMLVSWDMGMIGARLFRAPDEVVTALAVAPGDVRLRRGEDQTVWVTTDRADASKAIRWRTAAGEWQTGVLEPGRADGVYTFRLRNLQRDTDYQVQVGRDRSRVYRILVWTPPEVVAIGLTYRYPDYLRLPEREAPYGGDISAPEGTEVTLSVAVNKALDRAELRLDSGAGVALARADELRWQGRLTVVENDRYCVVLQDAEGEGNPHPKAYKIAAQADRPPETRIRFPRGDDEATPLEEVVLGFVVKDDFGLADYGVQYDVAGRERVRVSLKRGTEGTAKAEAEYLLALEDLRVQPGDLVTWAAWADDGKPGRAEADGLGDPYFLEVRPFARFFRPAVSNQGGRQMQQAGGGDDPAAQQKRIIIATWNLRKAAPRLDPEDYERQLGAVAEAQRGVLGSALDAAGTEGGLAAEGLRREVAAALAALGEAAQPDSDGALSRAIGHEQRAYRYMLQMAPEETEVAQSRGGRGVGRGEDARQRELDGLEMARRRDFREEASTLQDQLAEAAQTRDKIGDLARRQTAINEDIARLVSEMERMDEAEREEARRRLAQLQDAQRRTMSALDAVNGEVASGDMDAEQAQQTREQLDAARRQMDRSAREMEGDRVQRARAAGNRALGALREAQEGLGRLSRQAAAERMRGLQAGMDSLRARQDGIAKDARARQRRRAVRPLAEAEADLEDMLAEREAQAEAFRRFMNDAGELAEVAGDSQGLMAQKLGDWLRETSREGIYEGMWDGQQHVRQGDWKAAAERETAVGTKLDSAAAGLEAVAQVLVRDDLDAMEKALERLSAVLPEGDAQWRPETVRDFAENGYRDWVDAVREAEALLPEGVDVRQRLAGIREGLWGIGQRYHRGAVPPQYDLVYDTAIKPMRLAAEALRDAVRDRRRAYGFASGNADAVPETYRPHVARYFRALSEMKEEEK